MSTLLSLCFEYMGLSLVVQLRQIWRADVFDFSDEKVNCFENPVEMIRILRHF